MGFESGVISYRVFYVPRGLPRDAWQQFARQAAPPLDTLGKDAIQGWVTGRHLLDRTITEETAYYAARLRLTLMKAERTIPQALLRAETRMEELAVMQAEGIESLPRARRSEIRKDVTERLLPTMPPTLTGIPMVYEHQTDRVYAAATTDKQVDALTLAFREAAGSDLVPMTPETAALKRKQVNARDLHPSSFSEHIADEEGGNSLGLDFLTWLWFFSEQRGGIIHVGSHEFAAAVEGPLTFFMEGRGSHLTVLRNGEPLLASETRSALLSGKKLRRAKLTLARVEESWTGTIDADSFVFRGFSMPKTDNLTPESRFEERMMSLGRFLEGFLAFYDRFLDERADKQSWSRTVEAMRKWVNERQVNA